MGVVMVKKLNPAKKVTKKVSRKVAISKSRRAQEATPAVAKVSTRAKTGTKTKKSKAATPLSFSEGSDMAIAFEEVLKGGASRSEVSARLNDMWSGTKTRNGNPKPVSTIMNHVIRRALQSGEYHLEQTWRVVKGEAEESTSTPAPAPVVPAKKSTKKLVKRQHKA